MNRLAAKLSKEACVFLAYFVFFVCLLGMAYNLLYPSFVVSHTATARARTQPH